MSQINSKVIGSLSQDKRFGDWWYSNPIEIPFFDNKAMSIIYMDYTRESDSSFEKEADQVLINFLSKSTKDRLEISKYVYQNCKDFMSMVGINDIAPVLREIKDEKEIWNYVTPVSVHVTRRPHKDKDIYLFIACDCLWEQEHGLQLVFRQGKKLTRVSDQDGHLTEADAYGKPDEEDVLLSKF